LKKGLIYACILLWGILPVFSKSPVGDTQAEIFDFTVMQNANKMDIKFTMKQITRGSFFTVEKSRDGKSFSKVIDIPVSENNPPTAEYFETDYQPYAGVSYYRIRQTDLSGNTIYSQVVTAKFEQNGSGTDESVMASIKTYEGRETLLLLRDTAGNDFILKTKVEPINNKIFAVNAYPYLPEGTYQVIGSTNDKLTSQKIIIK
jgi:hypothetical protein